MLRKRPLDPWMSHIDLVQEVERLMTQVETLQKQVDALTANQEKHDAQN